MSKKTDSNDALLREATTGTLGKPTESPFRFAPLIKSGRSFLKVDWDSRYELFQRMEENGLAPI